MNDEFENVLPVDEEPVDVPPSVVEPEITKKDIIDRIPMNVLQPNESGDAEKDGFEVYIAKKLMKVSFSPSVALPAKFTIKQITSKDAEIVLAQRTASNRLGLTIPVSSLKGKYIAELQDKNGKISSVNFTV